MLDRRLSGLNCDNHQVTVAIGQECVPASGVGRTPDRRGWCVGSGREEAIA